MIVMYFEVSELTCCMKIWCRGLGFITSYGALLLKTWRISVVFRVKSATTIKIPDSSLIQRLGLLVGVFAVFLVIRMIIGRPEVTIGKYSQGLDTLAGGKNIE